MQNDYIMRMVQQFVLAILAIIQKRKDGNYQEAIESIKTASRLYLKADMDLILLTYTSDQITDYFKDFEDCVDTERCILFADLLWELALIYEVQKQESTQLKKMCLHLYTSSIPKQSLFQTSEYFEKIDLLKKELQTDL